MVIGKKIFLWECEHCERYLQGKDLKVVYKTGSGWTGDDDHYMVHRKCGCQVKRIEEE